jgi:isoleucyl-tRNA synthetase
MRAITTLLAKQSMKKIAQTMAEGNNIVLKENGNEWELTPENVIVTKKFPENLIINENVEPVLMMDIEITEDLLLEGVARDIVRHVQQIRKEIGLEIQDHIKVYFEGNNKIFQTALDKHKLYICRETLCDHIETLNISEDADSKEVKISGAVILFKVMKVD